jgi:predicted amidohydrolase YtcJ
MASSKADLVLRNARAITLDRRFPRARTIYVQNGLILKISSADIESSLTGPYTKILDCAGKTVIPAFHDAHCHIVAYAEGLITVDAGPASVRSIDDLINRIRKIAAVTPAGQWIRCAGYNEFYLKEKRHPLKYDLDRATLAHPVKVTHRSGHAHVLSTAALKLAGIGNESEEPDGGMIERDLESGEPNGLLFGMGAYLAQKIPPIGSGELDTAITEAGRTLLSLGITSVQDASPGNGPARWRQFEDWKKRGIFPPRTVLMFGAANAGHLGEMKEIKGILGKGAVKLVLDEVRGKLNPSQAEINRMLLHINKSGLQAAIHAVEENTVNAAIKALDYALTDYPREDHRHRVEHCSICSSGAAARLAALGAAVVTNPAFIYYSGERYLSDVPAGQFQHLYALNSMLGAGLRVAGGSDAPVACPDPLKAVYSAVTRRAENGREVLTRQSINVIDALALFTSGAAYSCFREKQLGTISKGKYADLAILNADPLRVKAEELKNIKVEMTLLNGDLAYTAAD